MVTLTNQVTCLWAKKRYEEGKHYWLPLITHLIDTQNTINWLFNHWLSPGQQQLLTQRFSEDEVQKLVKFIGFTHDIGKATPVFQTKQSFDGDSDLDEELSELLIHHGFTGLNDFKSQSSSKSPHARAGEALLDIWNVPESVAAIIGGHHGRPEDSPQKEQIFDYTANYMQLDVAKSAADKKIQQNWKNVQTNIFQFGLNSSGYSEISEIPNINQPEAILLEGLLIMADWLASSETLGNIKNTPLFPLIGLNQTWSDIDMSARFKNAILAWHQSGEWLPGLVGTDGDPYQKRWGFNARPVQKAMTEAIASTNDPGMVIVEAPMGLGKTEIALVAAEQLAYKTGRNGLFMGLPTQATSNAMFERVNHWLSQLARTQDENFSIKLMHGKAEFNEEYQAIPNASNINDLGAVVINSWFSGKKSILNKFIVGTIDNFLLLGLKQKHLFLKHLGLSDKVIILDEVHAYDAFMSQYMYKAIEWLGAYHVPIIILSATLPKGRRNALLKSYYKGKYGRHFNKNVIVPDKWQDNQAYPLLSIFDGKEIRQITDFGQNNPQILSIKVTRVQTDDDDVIQSILKKIQGGGVAGVIVNTVRRAQTLARLVPQSVPLMVLHSAFLAPDRATRERKLENTIGKHAKRPDKMIVIGTQVLEQSLDIDFDVMYTDIAPMDLILQRVGRLHRHQIKRPSELQNPQLYVMGINGYGDYGDSNESIYEKYLLMKTDHFLGTSIQLPTDISQLVQEVYDQKTDEFVDGINKAQEKFETDLGKEEQKAKVFQIDEPNLRASATDDATTIHKWLSCSQKQVDVDEQRANAAVRDIQETLEVILVKHTDAGNYLLTGQNMRGVPPMKIAQQVIRLPLAVTPSYNIDKIITELETRTRRYFSDWQDSRWLRGVLALPLDDNNNSQLDNWQLHYSSIFGLSYDKEDENG